MNLENYMDEQPMTATRLFTGLDYKNFDQHIEDMKFLNLTMVSFKVDDTELELTLQGNPEMLKTFYGWIKNAVNWSV
jgi:hypothetical protein